MNKMQQQQQAPQMMNSAPSTPLNRVSTEQIQKYLDENKNLIMAILESQTKGKVAECAQYQAILQKNLMYLAAIADAQPPGSGASQPNPTGQATPQGNSQLMQPQPSTVQQQQQQQQQQSSGGPVPKLPFQLNALRPQDQQNQMLQFQQQQQQLPAHFSMGGAANNGLHLLMQPGLGNTGSLMDMRGNQPGGLEGNSGNNGQGNSSLGPVEGRE